MLKEEDILYEQGRYWVKKADSFKGFEVYEVGITHSKRVARIGFVGEEGLRKAETEINRRLADERKER